MIRSKIEARERALELAVKTFETSQSFSSKNFMGWVTLFEKYLMGDVELTEVFDDFIKSLPEDVIRDKGLVGIIPCKSTEE